MTGEDEKLRDRLVMSALPTLLERMERLPPEHADEPSAYGMLARQAFAIAEALLAERGRRTGSAPDRSAVIPPGLAPVE